MKKTMHEARFFLGLMVVLVCVLESQAAIKNIVHLSDIHLDPVFGYPCGHPYSKAQIPWPVDDFPALLARLRELQGTTNGTYGQFGCDAAPALFAALVDQLKTLNQQSPFDAIVVSGDEAAHHLESDQIIVAIQAVAQQLQTIPSLRGPSPPSSNQACASTTQIPTYYALGNNDVAPDYFFTCGDPWYQEIQRKAWNNSIPVDQLSSWQQSGSYVVHDPFCTGDKQSRLIILNTVLYSSSRDPNFSQIDPCDQFSWLQNQISSPSNNVNFFLGHIPPGIDTFSGSLFYTDQYNDKMIEIFEQAQQASQSMGFFGHRHTDEFRTFFGKKGPDDPAQVTSPGIAMQASISPIFGNNPSFRIYQFDTQTNLIVNYQQFVFDLNVSNTLNQPTWYLEYDFDKSYQQSNVTSASFLQLFNSLASNPAEFAIWFDRLYCGSDDHSPSTLTNQQYLCALRARIPPDLSPCVKQLPASKRR